MKIRVSCRVGVILLVQMIALNVIAQNLPKGEVDITVEQFEQKQDLLYVKFHLDITNIKMKPKQALVYTPIIYTLVKSIDLPEISLRGRNNYKSYIREITLNREPGKASIKAFGKNKKILDYEYIIPYEDWMSDAKFVMNSELSKCGNLTNIGLYTFANIVLEPMPLPLPIVEEVVAISVIEEIPADYLSVSHISIHGNDLKSLYKQKDEDIFKVYFPVNVSNIEEGYMGNAGELNRLRTVINEVRAANDFDIAKVFIVGFASIDGSYEENEVLSFKRTESIDRYLSSRINVSESLIEVSIGAENWDGLRKMVVNSDMPRRAEVLGIIDNVPNYGERNDLLMNLNAGKTYKYMIDNFFQKLRYVYIKVYVDEKSQ